MKIGEILKLTQTDSLANIARDSLTIGRQKAREGLLKAGCYSINGVRGWFFDGDDSVLKKSIYDFVEDKKRLPRPKEYKTNVGTKELSNKRAKAEIELSNKEVASTLEQTNKRTNIVRKRSSFDLDVELMKDLKIQAIIQDRNVYEIVETAIRQYLTELRRD